MSAFKFDKIRIDPVDLAIAGNGILGIKDSGKSYTATMLAEHIHDAGIPFTAFDPTGIWKFLRVPGAGKGRPVIVVGLGPDADLRLSGATIAKVIEAAMQSGVSLVIDLSHPDLSKADWRRIVRDGVRTLLHKNEPYGLRHVFLEEAAEFVPQKINDGLVYAEIEKLARIGGNARLGYTLINQRAEEVNKAVLELCDNLFLHRQKGKNSLLSLRKWMDVADVEDGQLIVNTLSKLPSGQCWAWMRESDRPVLCKVPLKDSFHPNRRELRGSAAVVKAKAVDVASFVTKLQSQLPAIEEHEKANDPALLRKRIAELEKAAKVPTSLLPDKATLVAEYERGYGEGISWALDSFAGLTKDAGHRLTHLAGELDALKRALEAPITRPKKFPRVDIPHAPRAAATPPAIRVQQPVLSVVRRDAGANGSLPPALQKVINAIGWWRQIGFDPVRKERACVVAGYSPRASTFGVYLADLSKRGLIESTPGMVGLTPEGAALAVVPTGDTREELRNVARGLLSPQEQRVFDVVYEAWPQEIRRDEVAEKVGLSPTASTAGVYISGVAAYGIIEAASRGHVKAADWLFP